MATIGPVFAAVPIPVEIRIALADRIESIELPGRPVPPEDWHVTLRYLGVIDQVTFERFIFGLSGASGMTQFRIHLDRFGAFPNPRRANVVWAGIGGGVEQLTSLNEVVESAAQMAGVEPEDRPFSPHLTLSRVRPPENVTTLMEEDLALGWVCDRVVVFATHREGEMRYQPLETCLLKAR